MSLFIVTVRLPRNPDHPAALKCKHPKDDDQHCSEMVCPNYVNNCPVHAIVPRDGYCSRKKTTGPCPAGEGTCTDVTGEHHSYLLGATSIEAAMAGAKTRLTPGAHITRVEDTGLGWNDF